MKKQSLNTGWKVAHLGSTEFVSVTLPHDAMLGERRTETSAGGTNTGWFEGFDYVYEREFEAPAAASVILELEGVYRNPEVFLNGEKIASRPYGYLPVFAELTPHLKEGKNILRVIARNAEQPNSRWYTGAGLYRPAWLYTGPKAHLVPDGIRVTTLSLDPPRIRVEAETSVPGDWTAEILDGDKVLGKVSSASPEAELPAAKLWSPESPNCYTCRVTFGEDTDETSFGIRQVTCNAKDGFCINGKRVLLKGACIHHDNGILGACAYDFAEERKIRLLREAGYNAIRSSHNPCSKALLKACDKLGMLVMDEYVDMWYIHKIRYDYASYFNDWWRQDLTDLIRRDYNHPSVVLYSLGNEVSETAQPRGIKLAQEMTEFCHALDASRPVTCGVNIFFNFLSSIGFGVYSDKKAEKEPQTPNPAKKKKAVGSEFFNNLAGLFGSGFMKFGATLHGSDVTTRKSFAHLDVAGYNYGIRRYKKDVKKYPDRVIVGSETFTADAAEFMHYAKQHPAIIGDFVWTGMDYLGEVGLGAMEYEEYAPDFSKGAGWLTSGCGALDLTGKPTCELAYTRVAFGLDSIRMGVVPVSGSGKRHSPSAWRMSNARESWSWQGCEGKTATVEVYSCAPRVKLFLNGSCVGEKATKKNGRTLFKLPYEKGTLTAVAYDEAGKECAKTSLQTAQDKTVLSLLPEQTGELCYVRVAYTDGAGQVKPMARGLVTLHVKGGELLGFGSAAPYNERGYLTNVSDTYYGEALAIIRPTDKQVLVEAESALGTAKLTLSVE